MSLPLKMSTRLIRLISWLGLLIPCNCSTVGIKLYQLFKQLPDTISRLRVMSRTHESDSHVSSVRVKQWTHNNSVCRGARHTSGERLDMLTHSELTDTIWPLQSQVNWVDQLGGQGSTDVSFTYRAVRYICDANKDIQTCVY